MRDRLHCEPLPSSVRSARLFVVDKLQEWRYDDLVDRVALLTSELATNAVVHTGQPYSVCVARYGSRVRVEVSDRGQPLPPRAGGGVAVDVAEHDPAAVDVDHCFSGLGIVDATATAWGSDAVPGDGKVVWFELEGQADGAQAARADDLLDLRQPTVSHLAEDLDRPLDEWVIALGQPHLPTAARVVLGILVVALCLVIALIVRG